MFWFSSLASYTIGNRKTRVNEYDKPHGIANAKELCIQCECELNKSVSFIELPAIEEKLNTNMHMLDIRGLPSIKADVNLYKHLLYKSENRHNGEHWLLYENVHSHLHVITNLRKFFGANYYCNECCRWFKIENTYNNHFHGL